MASQLNIPSSNHIVCHLTGRMRWGGRREGGEGRGGIEGNVRSYNHFKHQLRDIGSHKTPDTGLPNGSLKCPLSTVSRHTKLHPPHLTLHSRSLLIICVTSPHFPPIHHVYHFITFTCTFVGCCPDFITFLEAYCGLSNSGCG